MGDIPAWALEDSDSDGGDDAPDWAKDNGKKKGGDIEMQKPPEENKYMTTFFKEVDGINADIKAVSAASKEIAVINEKAMRATTTSEEKSLSERLGPLISRTNKQAKRTKTLLGLLKEETEKLKAEGKLNASDVRYVTKSCVMLLARMFRIYHCLFHSHHTS